MSYFLKTSLRTRKVDSNSMCSIKKSQIPSDLFAGKVSQVGIILTLKRDLCNSSRLKEVSQGQ